MNFKKIDLNNANINKYKSKHKGLSHIRTGKDYKGYIYIDNQDNVVGFINMRISDKYIQAIEVSPEYQGQGLGKTLLNELIKMGSTRLSVNKKNTKAKKMYDKLFKVEREDKHMYYMVLKISDYLKESRNLSIINSFSFKDITNSNIILTENFNIIGENIHVNDIEIQDISKTGILMEADDDLGPTDYNSDDLGGADEVSDDGGDDLSPTDYNEDSEDDTSDDTTSDETDDSADTTTEDDSGDDDLDSLENDTDDPTSDPSDGGEGEDVENSNDEQMNNDDQNNDNDNENNKFLIRDYIELYNRLDEILEKINSNEKFKFSRDVVYNKARLNIEKIRDMLFDYITQRFNKESYVSNLYHFNLVIQAININIAMIEKSPTIAEINERNKEKEAKSKKNEKTKRSK